MNKSPPNFMVDVHRLKPGLIIYRRTDVQHNNWYCRIKLAGQDRYKRISLKTANIDEATVAALRHDIAIETKLQHQLPVFEKPFREVALEYSEHQRRLSEIGQITHRRWITLDGHIRLHLIPYIGNVQITLVTEEKWTEYPFWRKKNNAPKKLRKHPLHKTVKVPLKNDGHENHGPAKAGTIRTEMITFRAIMRFAAKKKYIPATHVPSGNMPEDRARREAFTSEEYKALYTYARDKWIDRPGTALNHWYRRMAYQFMLVMANTGMRNSEARNLKWRDVDQRKAKDGRTFVVLNVRGKSKHRELIAGPNVAGFLERIRALFIDAQKRRWKGVAHGEPGPKPDDHVFSIYSGKQAKSLYDTLIADLLEKSGLLYSSNGSRRSIYSFRHTYATFRLAAGTDSYFLAKQMGTSVKMIEDHYGHVAPAKNAELILRGLPEWDMPAPGSGEQASRVNADATGAKAKPRARARREGKDLPAGRGGAKHRPASRSTRRR
jgi:integrase